VKSAPRLLAAIPLALAVLAVGGAVAYGQLEGADRGVPPIDSASSLEVTGVTVDVTAENANAARTEGWRRAQLEGWRMLWSRTTSRPVGEAPALPESVLNSIVSGIIIEQEQIGPRRYIARLGVLFDRARTGQFLGVQGIARRSAPLLVVPVMVTGATPYSFEFRNEWQRAWARFRTAASPIDYVRPTGTGVDPTLLNLAQAGRRGRGWWRILLDQFGAADILVPQVHIHRLYPGGPAIGTFTARFGPDYRLLGRFRLRAEHSGAIPRMLDEGVRRLDQIYIQALESGALSPDPTLIIEEPELLVPPEQLLEQERAVDERPEAATGPSAPPPDPARSFTVQVATADAAAVQQAEVSVSGVGGVTSAFTTNPAIGGTSTMRVTFSGDAESLAAGLRSRGWNVEVVGGNSLRISR
jgi:hypothetical protein